MALLRAGMEDTIRQKSDARVRAVEAEMSTLRSQLTEAEHVTAVSNRKRQHAERVAADANTLIDELSETLCAAREQAAAACEKVVVLQKGYEREMRKEREEGVQQAGECFRPRAG